MKVHLIKKQAIEDFTSKHARSSKSFQIWLAILRQNEIHHHQIKKAILRILHANGITRRD